MTTALSVGLTYLQSSSSREIGRILYLAYASDPMFRQIFDAPKVNFDASLNALLREELGLLYQLSQPVIGATDGERLLGAACLFEPGHVTGERQWEWRMRMLMSSGVACTSRYLEKEFRIRQALPSDNCHLLSFLGVLPAARRQGIGETLLTGVESRVEEHPTSEGCAVFVNEPSLMQWLRRHGYIEIAPVEFANTHGMLAYRPRANPKAL